MSAMMCYMQAYMAHDQITSMQNPSGRLFRLWIASDSQGTGSSALVFHHQSFWIAQSTAQRLVFETRAGASIIVRATILFGIGLPYVLAAESRIGHAWFPTRRR